MSRIRATAAIALIAFALAANTARADEIANFQARYELLHTAMNTRDPAAIKPLLTPDFAATDIQGSTIYLTDAGGNLVKITTSAASTIRKTDPGTMADIKLGQTLIVTGAKAADGSTAARTLTISTAALGSGGGGFGFGGGGGTGG